MNKKSIPLLLALAAAFSSPAWAAPTYQLRLIAVGVKPPPPAADALTATLAGSADFGQVTVGQAQGLMLTLTNTAAQAPLTVSGILVSGSELSRTGSDSCPKQFPAVLPASSSCTILAVWSPTAAGALGAASVLVQDDAYGGNQTRTLTGTAVLPPAASSITGATDFGSLPAGTTKTVSATIRNTSQYTPLHVTAISVTGTAVSWKPAATGISCSSTFPQTIAPNASCTVDVTWAPVAAGPLSSAVLSVTDDAQTAPHQLSLTGTATAAQDPYFANVVTLMPFEGTGEIKGNPIVNVGNVTVSSTVKRQGNGSAYLSGAAGQALKIDNPGLYDFPGDFTIEGFINPASTGGTVFDIGGVNQVNWQSQSLWLANGHLIYNASSANAGADIASNLDIGATSAGSWNHFAITRSGTVYRTFVNGRLTQTISVNKKPYTPQYGIIFGTYPQGSWTSLTSVNSAMYLDEFRVTKGVARYTSDFTVPATAFPVQ